MSTPDVDLELGESTPLMGGKKPLGELPEYSWRERAVAALAAVSVAASVVSIIVSLGNPLVIVSAVLGLLAAPYAVFQQQKITQCLALVETNQRVREEVDTLNRENRKLQENVEQLGTSVKNLKVQKEKLDIINSTQVTSLDALENQLEESKEILNKMKQNVQGEILGNLFDVLLVADLNGDDVLNDEEIQELIVKMERLNGVDFNDQMVKQTIIDNGRSIDAIMELVQNLMSKDVEERNKYFHITKQ
ncbi:unnamed protein product [Cylindrotheca closterium]|uniref:Uncharacterized protein n=1 Tax=Cylindrotheca closterium TaxID=2856 RepID=A0AAD2FVG0_9STRA|nr:unnamed protein product [Cylindrotheca closterium]